MTGSVEVLIEDVGGATESGGSGGQERTHGSEGGLGSPGGGGGEGRAGGEAQVRSVEAEAVADAVDDRVAGVGGEEEARGVDGGRRRVVVREIEGADARAGEPERAGAARSIERRDRDVGAEQDVLPLGPELAEQDLPRKTLDLRVVHG
jgi:hypothetical protein